MAPTSPHEGPPGSVEPGPKTPRVLVAWGGMLGGGAAMLRHALLRRGITIELAEATCSDDEIAGAVLDGGWDVLVVEPASPPLLEKLRSAGVQVPILALCGWGEQHFAAALDAGASQVVALPVNVDEFVAALMRFTPMASVR